MILGDIHIPVDIIHGEEEINHIEHITPKITEQNGKYYFQTTMAHTIPGRSEKFVEVEPADYVGDYGMFVTEPKPTEPGTLLVAKSLHSLWEWNQKSFVRVMNLEECDVSIGKSEKIVEISEVSQSQL